MDKAEGIYAMAIRASGPGQPRSLLRWLPLAGIALAALLFLAFGYENWLSFDALKNHRQALLAAVEQYPAPTAALFVALYAVSTALSLPIATLLTLVGGFLFGALAGTGYVVLGATLGAAMLFLAARSAMGSGLRDRAGPWLGRLQDGFRENAFSYLLFLRLVPVFPFFVVNLVPALLGMRLLPYLAATLIGILPASAIYVYAGVGLGSVFDRGETFSLSGILTPEMTAALIGLALLSLVPILLGKLRRRGATLPARAKRPVPPGDESR